MMPAELGKRSKISDVAKRAGVSLSTVSNYLNGRYYNMSYQTRKNVEKAIHELQYTPSITARRLSAKQKCGVLCLVIPVNISHFFDSFYYPIVLTSVGNLSAKLEHNVLIYVRNGRNPQEELEYLKGMHGAIADGFILFDLTDGDEYYLEFERAHIPYVCVGQPTTREACTYVASDHRQSMVDAVDYLAGLGHRRIAVMLDKSSSVTKIARYQGYLEGLQRHGLPLREEYVGYLNTATNSGAEDCRQFLGDLLAGENPPTALIAFAGYAREIESICKRNGCQIPQDLSVVLLDYVESIHSHSSKRRYTSFSNIADQVAEHAVHMLLRRIDGPEAPAVSELIPLTLSVGGSTGKAPEK